LRNLAMEAGESNDGAGYTSALREILGHSPTCRECRVAHTEEVYCHPVVEQTVRRLGGRAALFTENLAADRARFLEAYEEILGRAVVEAGRLPEVANWLESDRNVEMKQLAEKMRG